MTPRTDVCHRCETLRREVANAVGEQEKLKASKCLFEHMEEAQRERDYHCRRTVEAGDELEALARPASPPVRPCSVKLQKVHYTFDFAHNVSLPHTARQVGPLFFQNTSEGSDIWDQLWGNTETNQLPARRG